MGGLGGRRGRWPAPAPGADFVAGMFEGQIDDRGGVEGQHLGNKQAAHDGDGQGLAKFGAGAHAQGQRHGAAKGGHGGHHDGPETDDAGFVNGFLGGELFLALGGEGKVHHHDGVLLDNAHEQNDADEGNQGKVHVEDHQRQQRPQAGGGQAGEDGQRMDQAFVEHAQNDENGQQRGGQQEGKGTEGGLEHLGRPLEAALHGGRQVQLARRFLDQIRRLAQGSAGVQIERDAGRRETGPGG